MEKCTASAPVRRATAHASLAALGVKLRELDLLAPIQEEVKIAQKTVKFTPFQKLCDCFVGILAGAHGIVEINEGLRTDPALQAAFGRTACAEQSVIQDPLDACTATNVAQMETAITRVFRQHSRAAHHDFAQKELLVDADMSGMPCGKKAAFATKGYFAGEKNRRGPQLGRGTGSKEAGGIVEPIFPRHGAPLPTPPAPRPTPQEDLAATAHA